MNVRVAGRMHIAQRAVHALGPLEQRNHARSLEKAGLADLDLRVARLRLQQRHPADFQLGAGADHEIGVARARDEAGSRLDSMRILQRGGCRIDAYPVAADLLGERAPLGLAGEDVQGGKRGPRRHQQNRTQE